MKITIICEGKTEQAFKETLHSFLQPLLPGKMPSLRFDVHHGSIPTGDTLKRVVENLLGETRNPSNAVIGLTDVYPGFTDAQDAKSKMRLWVGEEPRFYPHVALHDFEAWLLPHLGSNYATCRSQGQSVWDKPGNHQSWKSPCSPTVSPVRSRHLPRQLQQTSGCEAYPEGRRSHDCD